MVLTFVQRRHPICMGVSSETFVHGLAVGTHVFASDWVQFLVGANENSLITARFSTANFA